MLLNLGAASRTLNTHQKASNRIGEPNLTCSLFPATFLCGLGGLRVIRRSLSWAARWGRELLLGRESSIQEPLPARQVVSPQWSGQSWF